MKTLHDIKDYDLTNARVLVRVDYDVPMENGKIKSDKRIRASLDTVNYLREKGAKVILLAHMGRPNGQVVEEFSLRPVADYLSGLINHPVMFAPDILSPETEKMIQDMNSSDVLLLENLRYYPGEEAGDEEFAKKVAALGTIYVNDAFATSHRGHASMKAIPALVEGGAYAGFQLQREVEALSKVVDNPKRPLVAIIGGKKVSDKVKVLENFLNFVDVILVGGGAANIFLQAQGFDIGSSFFEEGYEDFVNNLLYNAEQKGVQIIIPEDVFVAKAIAADQPVTLKDVADIGDGDVIVDIGTQTVEKFNEAIGFAGTIVWNGPLGVFEYPEFRKGNDAVAKAVTESGAFSLIGGGDTIASLPADLKDKFGYISTAGGATLDFLGGKELPGVKAVE